MIGALIARGGGNSGPSATETSKAALQVISTRAVNRPPRVEALAKYNAADVSGVVLTLRDPGNGVSVIDRVRFVVKQFAALSDIGCIPGAGPIPISANYRATLPSVAHPGQTIDAPLSQEVRANSADRMKIGLDVKSNGPYVYETSDGTGASRIYRMDVLLYHDKERKPVDAGAVILAIPFPAYSLFPGGQQTSTLVSGACWKHNPGTLRGMLALGGARSPELKAFGENPKGEYCSEPKRNSSVCS